MTCGGGGLLCRVSGLSSSVTSSLESSSSRAAMAPALAKIFYQQLKDEDIYLENGQNDDQPFCIRCTKVVNAKMGL